MSTTGAQGRVAGAAELPMGAARAASTPRQEGLADRGVAAGLCKAGPTDEAPGRRPRGSDPARGLQARTAGPAAVGRVTRGPGQRGPSCDPAWRLSPSVTKAAPGSRWRSGRGEPGSGPWRRRGAARTAGAGASTAAHSGQGPHGQERKHTRALPEPLLGESVPIPLITAEEEREARGFRVRDQRLDGDPGITVSPSAPQAKGRTALAPLTV